MPGPLTGSGGRARNRDAEVGSAPILTSEHRLGPRNYRHHHGLLLVLPFLAFERHFEAVQRGALGLQGHGAAGGYFDDRTLEDERAGLGAHSAAAPARSPLPVAGRPALAGPVTGASGPPRYQERPDPEWGGLNPGPQPPAAPFYGGSLSAPARPARRGPTPEPGWANRTRLRPLHAAPLESQDPRGGGKAELAPGCPPAWRRGSRASDRGPQTPPGEVILGRAQWVESSGSSPLRCQSGIFWWHEEFWSGVAFPFP